MESLKEKLSTSLFFSITFRIQLLAICSHVQNNFFIEKKKDFSFFWMARNMDLIFELVRTIFVSALKPYVIKDSIIEWDENMENTYRKSNNFK